MPSELKTHSSIHYSKYNTVKHESTCLKCSNTVLQLIVRVFSIILARTVNSYRIVTILTYNSLF